MNRKLETGARPEALDEILASEEELVPSSGFLTAAMDRVRDEAAAPQPIPFPWKLAVPGMVLAVGTIGWLIYEFVQFALAGGLRLDWSGSLMPAHLPAQSQHVLTPALWIAFALAISLASWAFARRLARGARLF